jgi:hypothetical protein
VGNGHGVVFSLLLRPTLELRITTQGNLINQSINRYPWLLFNPVLPGRWLSPLGDCILAPAANLSHKANPALGRRNRTDADPQIHRIRGPPSHPSPPSIKEKTKRTDVFRPQPPFPEPCDTEMRQVLFVRINVSKAEDLISPQLHECILYYACVPQRILDSQPGVAVDS